MQDGIEAPTNQLEEAQRKLVRCAIALDLLSRHLCGGWFGWGVCVSVLYASLQNSGHPPSYWWDLVESEFCPIFCSQNPLSKTRVENGGFEFFFNWILRAGGPKRVARVGGGLRAACATRVRFGGFN